MTIHDDAKLMVSSIIADNMPGRSVKVALRSYEFTGRIYVVAIGKAAWTMAHAASEELGARIAGGVVVTKYGHSQGEISPGIRIFEAGHPVSDENSIAATQECIDLAAKLTADDELLFLVSGGGSALFEKPLDGVSLGDIQELNSRLLASGADIVEMNMVRKRLSAVKAGRFAQIAAPAKIYSVILSDVLGDRLDSIASGPSVADASTADDALGVIKKYGLERELGGLQHILAYLAKETPKEIANVTTAVTGSVRTLCESAAKTARELGYTPYVLTTTMSCEAREAGRLLASVAADAREGRSFFKPPCAIIAGGETVVTLKGGGKGGRNQEIALAAAKGIAGLRDILMFSLGSDGTDGPTDAAGGMADGETAATLHSKGIDIDAVLADNDAYHGLSEAGGLIMTGPTGTNVNDVTVILCR